MASRQTDIKNASKLVYAEASLLLAPWKHGLFGFQSLPFEIAQRQFQPTEVGMVVLADGKGDVDGIAGEQRRLLQAFGHVPAEGIEDRSHVRLPLGPGRTSIRFQLQFDVFVLQDFRRSEQADVAGGKCRFVIARAIRFQQAQRLKERRSDFGEVEFGFDVENWIEISRREAQTGVSIQLGSQLRTFADGMAKPQA